MRPAWMAQERQHTRRPLDGGAMRSENETRNPLPVSLDAKRTMQAPRGAEHRAEDGSGYRAHSASPAQAWTLHERGKSGASLYSRTYLGEPRRVERHLREAVKPVTGAPAGT
jgi:hypothetical protein